MNEGQENQQKKQKWVILLLLLITIAALCVTMWAVFFRDSGSGEPLLIPDYAPQQEDENVEQIENDNDEKLDAPEGGGSVSLTYSTDVSVDLSTGKIEFLFANPGRSNQSMVLQIVVQDTAIAQSGTIKPGKQISEMQLAENLNQKMPAGIYEGYFNVQYYDLQTDEKAILNTQIPVVVTVK